MISNILQYLDRAAQLWPDRVVLSGEDGDLTFRELRELADHVGSFLCRKGIFRQPVGIRMPRGTRAFAMSLGCVAGGCWFSFLDPQMPSLRAQKILDSLQPPGVIGDTWEAELLLREPIDSAALSSVRQRSASCDPIYAVFTSGSTGEPKGVIGCHRAVIDYIENLCPVLKADADTVFGSHAPLYVDAWLKELFPALKYGGKMVLIPQRLFSFPVQLVQFLNGHKINTLCWVVSALTGVSGTGTLRTIRPEHLKTVAFASEVFPPEQLKLWREALPQTRFLNLYGPTEATGICCWHEVSGDEEGPIPIGKPLANTEVFLHEGEICIRGDRLTLGYLGEDQGGFTSDPRGYPGRIYRTGDLGAWNEKGQLLFLGRKDSQIKHMGYRIELGEIEAAAWKLPGITGVGCVYLPEQKCLVLCYSGTPLPEELRQHLRQLLPKPMVPRRIRRMEILPRTPNGKLRRSALLDMERNGTYGKTVEDTY